MDGGEQKRQSHREKERRPGEGRDGDWSYAAHMLRSTKGCWQSPEVKRESLTGLTFRI